MNSNPPTAITPRDAVKAILADIALWSRFVAGRPLRHYQLEPAYAILDSILHRRGLTFAVAMARQAGKNETQAQLEGYLLMLHAHKGGFLVKGSPTFKPQTINSLMRLERTLDNPWTHGRYQREQQYMIRLGKARAAFFSAQPTANVVGATADILLQADEAQDIDPDRWSKAFRPMAASTNATTVLWGTIWTEQTLLGAALRTLQEQERKDGRRRVFLVPWERVAEENPAYGDYVRAEIARLGENHPIVKTQYRLMEIDQAGGLLPAQRLAQMHGDHPRQHSATPGKRYALLVDVAGEEDDPTDPNPHRDATALTVVELLPPRSRTAGIFASGVFASRQPAYRVVDRRLWTGVSHASLYQTILDLATSVWKAQHLVIDATGIGAGLSSFLSAALPGKVLPFTFTAASKSDLGWGFLAAIDSGRFKDYAEDDQADTRLFWQQAAAADYELLDGPAKRMRWSVADPDLHDDLLISAALVAALDKLDWGLYRPGAVIEAPREEL